MKPGRNGQLVKEPSSQQPTPKTVSITKEQLAGIVSRQQVLEAAQGQLNTYLSGVVNGHGYDRVQVTAIDDKKLTLTFVELGS